MKAFPRDRSIRIGIIGAGPGGLCMAIRLAQAGFEDFTIFEKAEGLGGTWYHNRYPGCACDVSSHLYSFSFEQKADWPRPYSGQPAILEYLEGCATKYGLGPHLRLGTEVEAALWNESTSSWRLSLAGGEVFEADILVGAVGMFNELAWPEIPGRERFRGTAFHSARWNEAHDLAGERVGVIGSAASAVQFVPQIAKQVGHLELFQRTANWVAPKDDTPYDAERLARFRADPESAFALRREVFDAVDRLITFESTELIESMERACLEALEVIEDPVVREKLRPTHPYGCKRPLISNDFYPTFNRPNVELVTDPIAEITESGLRLENGEERAYDTLIFATGFEASTYLAVIDVVGRGGRSIAEAWKDGAIAYRGIQTAGFPNLFMLYGPNTNNGSILYMIEEEVDYSIRLIEKICAEQLAWIDVKPSAMEAYNRELQQRMDEVEAWSASCSTYYRAPSGRIVTQWPGGMTEFKALLAEIDLEAFESEPLSAA